MSPFSHLMQLRQIFYNTSTSKHLPLSVDTAVTTLVTHMAVSLPRPVNTEVNSAHSDGQVTLYSYQQPWDVSNRCQVARIPLVFSSDATLANMLITIVVLLMTAAFFNVWQLMQYKWCFDTLFRSMPWRWKRIILHVSPLQCVTFTMCHLYYVSPLQCLDSAG